MPAVVDADALNALAGDLPHTDKIRILTPHPGEMSRLMGISTKEVQADRLGNAQSFARQMRRHDRSQRRPNHHRVPGWRNLDQSDRLAVHGNRRDRATF